MNNKIKMVAYISVFAALSIVLMMISIPVFFAPNFYKIDLSDVPAILVAVIYGPFYGVLVEIIKIIVHCILKGMSDYGIGAFANLLIGSIFVFTFGYTYRLLKLKFKMLISSVLAVLMMVLVASLLNKYLLIPIYEKMFHLDVVSMGNKINSSVNSMDTFIIFCVAPFNLLKASIESLIAVFLYKRIGELFLGNNL